MCVMGLSLFCRGEAGTGRNAGLRDSEAWRQSRAFGSARPIPAFPELTHSLPFKSFWAGCYGRGCVIYYHARSLSFYRRKQNLLGHGYWACPRSSTTHTNTSNQGPVSRGPDRGLYELEQILHTLFQTFRLGGSMDFSGEGL